MHKSFGGKMNKEKTYQEVAYSKTFIMPCNGSYYRIPVFGIRKKLKRKKKPTKK
jgi:hypothetical protein